MLERRDVLLRCMARHAEHLRPRLVELTDILQVDVLDTVSLAPALADIYTAYHLIHSMETGSDFEDQDRRGAGTFVSAARQASDGLATFAAG